jgi:HK97 family phage portal protein
MNLLDRIKRPFVKKAAEGQPRGGPFVLSDGWLPAGTPWNFWQMGRNVRSYGQTSAMVEACVSAYSQTIAMCPGDHWVQREDGGRDRQKPAVSALARILRQPNDYQTISDFLLNLTRSLYAEGNAFALALRNNRGEVAELHLMQPRNCSAQIAVDGSIFYSLGGNQVLDQREFDLTAVPARDVLHVRLHTPRHPLKGESPVLAAALDIAASDAMLQQQISFFTNQAKPSFVISTDEKMTKEQAADLRAAWQEQTTGENAGRTPILTWGLKAQQIGSTAIDSQLAETMKMTQEHVALVFRVPLQILGIGGTPFASTEALMQSWRATGLGFALNHIEEAFGQLFRLKGYPYEYLELSTDALMRSAFKDRIEGLARAVQGTLMSPDEARADLDLGPAPGGNGDEPRAQMQLMPLSWHRRPADPAAAPVPAPDEPEDDKPDDEDKPDDVAEDAEKHAERQQIVASTRARLARKLRHECRDRRGD